jgi:hypothetical protein
MDILISIFLLEVDILIAIVIIFLILLIWILLGKTVVTAPSITLAPLSPAQYDHGDTVSCSGVVYSDKTTPAPGETVDLTLTDSKGTLFDLGTVVTDQNGAFSDSFVVPGVAPGAVTLTATDTALGVSATQSFTLERSKMRFEE